MPKLTMRFVESIKLDPTKGRIQYYRDDQLQGFGLMVREKSISYFVEKRVNGKSKRQVIGNFPLLSPEQARNDALIVLAGMAKGEIPSRSTDIRKAPVVTLRQAFDDFMQSKEYRPITRYNYPRVMNKNLGDWLDKPLTAITRDMVEERFRLLSSGTAIGTPGKANANITMKLLRGVLNYAMFKYEIDGVPALASNPVSRLTQTKAWHRLNPRQGVIPDYKLATWAKAVMRLSNPTARDYYLVLLFTGLRRNEAPRLEWKDIDFEAKTLHLRAEIAKNGIENLLPLSTFLFDLFQRRYNDRNGSEYVFPAYRTKGRYYGCQDTLNKLREESGCEFIIHDARRTFLTTAEKIDIPYYAIKKLAGHSMRDDITAGYLVIDVERLREPMQKISDRFAELMNLKSASLIEVDCWQVALTS